jgi:hypothetical protein
MRKAKLLWGLLLAVVAAQPPNDDPCGAITLTPSAGCTYVSGNLNGATATPGIPAPGCASYQGGDVWYNFPVPLGGRVIIQVNSGFDLGMAIYSAPGCGGPFTLIECDDDDGPGRNPTICRTGGSSAGCTGVDPGVRCQYNAALTPGTTIWIRIWRYGTANPGNTPFQICVIDCGTSGGGGGGGCGASNYTAYQCPCPGPAGGNWCGAGCTGAGITIDDTYSPSWIAIPFNFYFAGNTYNQLLIGANGHVVFPPSGYRPGNRDDWRWDSYVNDLYSIQFQLDIHPGLGGTICYRTIGAAPNRCFVVQYCNVPYFDRDRCPGYFFTGELRLCENGSIQINIDNMPTCTNWNGGGCFVGIIGGPGDMWAIYDLQPCPALTNTCYAFTPPGACRPSTPPPGCTPLAISLHSFTGQQEGDVVWLRWESITEDGAQRYRIERSTDLRSWQEIGELPARGASSVYTFADRELPAQVGSVFYRLWVESEAGKAQSFGPVEVVLEAKRPVRIRQITLRSDEPLTVELLTGDDFILSVWAPTGQRVWEEQVTGPGRYTIPAFVFGRGMYLVQVRTARGELYVYRVLGL